MDPRICHALQCVEPAVYYRCLCARHWLRLPPEYQHRVIADMAKADTKTTGSSGSFATAVLIALRWLAVSEGLMPGPLPKLP